MRESVSCKKDFTNKNSIGKKITENSSNAILSKNLLLFKLKLLPSSFIKNLYRIFTIYT